MTARRALIEATAVVLSIGMSGFVRDGTVRPMPAFLFCCISAAYFVARNADHLGRFAVRTALAAILLMTLGGVVMLYLRTDATPSVVRGSRQSAIGAVFNPEVSR